MDEIEIYRQTDEDRGRQTHRLLYTVHSWMDAYRMSSMVVVVVAEAAWSSLLRLESSSDADARV